MKIISIISISSIVSIPFVVVKYEHRLLIGIVRIIEIVVAYIVAITNDVGAVDIISSG